MLPPLLPEEGDETVEVPVVGLVVAGVSILYLGLADSETKSMDLIYGLFP